MLKLCSRLCCHALSFRLNLVCDEREVLTNYPSLGQLRFFPLTHQLSSHKRRSPTIHRLQVTTFLKKNFQYFALHETFKNFPFGFDVKNIFIQHFYANNERRQWCGT